MLEFLKQWAQVNGLNLLVNVSIFAAILFAGKYVILTLCALAEKSLEKVKRINDLLRTFFVNVLHKILWLVVLMLALPRLGIDVAPLIAGLGVTGFILGFAFQESLGNLAAGIMLVLNHPFAVGDYVEAAGMAGSVKELNMMATTMLTPDNRRITIPNSKIWGAPITNYAAMPTRRVDLKIGVAYSTDIGKARDVIAGILNANDLVLKDPKPVIEIVEFADSSINLVVRPWCKTSDYWAVVFAVNAAIKQGFNDAGIEIPFPQMDVHVKPEAGAAS